MRDGLTEDRIAAVEDYQDSDAFTPQEKIIMYPENWTGD